MYGKLLCGAFPVGPTGDTENTSLGVLMGSPPGRSLTTANAVVASHWGGNGPIKGKTTVRRSECGFKVCMCRSEPRKRSCVSSGKKASKMTVKHRKGD